MRPAAHLLFLTRQEKKAKEGDPTVRVPFAALRGNLRCSRSGCSRRTHFAALQLRSNNCGQSEHEAWTSFGAHAHPDRCASRHGQRGRGAKSGHRCARPWIRGAKRSRVGGRAQRWPVWTSPPSGCAWVGVLAGWLLHRRMQSLRALAGRSCLNGAAQQQSEFCGPPRQRPDPGRPVAQAKGSQPVGRTSFAFFSCASKKRRCAAGRNSRPPHLNQAQQRTS